MTEKIQKFNVYVELTIHRSFKNEANNDNKM